MPDPYYSILQTLQSDLDYIIDTRREHPRIAPHRRRFSADPLLPPRFLYPISSTRPQRPRWEVNLAHECMIRQIVNRDGFDPTIPEHMADMSRSALLEAIVNALHMCQDRHKHLRVTQYKEVYDVGMRRGTLDGRWPRPESQKDKDARYLRFYKAMLVEFDGDELKANEYAREMIARRGKDTLIVDTITKAQLASFDAAHPDRAIREIHPLWERIQFSLYSTMDARALVVLFTLPEYLPIEFTIKADEKWMIGQMRRDAEMAEYVTQGILPMPEWAPGSERCGRCNRVVECKLMTPLDAETVKAIRQRVQMTQEQFGNKVGVNIRAVQYWERGERVPDEHSHRSIIESFDSNN